MKITYRGMSNNMGNVELIQVVGVWCEDICWNLWSHSHCRL